MTMKRIHEAGTIALDLATKAFRVCLITEGAGSSADFKREFFVQKNAEALAGSLSFPAHPMDLEKPEHRDPLSAIGQIGDTITIEEHDGKMGFWGEYIPAKSKPQIAEYLAEFGPKLGLSIYQDSDGHNDPATGRWIAESLDASDAYKSVDLVVAAGRGGKFEKVAEALGLLPKASATAGEEEVSPMEIKEVNDSVVALAKVVEGLVSTLEGKAKADLQVEADTSAVNKAVEGRLGDYDKAVSLITEAKLTESQTASLRALALKGEDVAPHIEDAKKILAEAKALAADPDGTKKIVESHLGGGEDKTDSGFAVPGFGKVN
jgi:hypothetical protein